jgi:hypothetical protein
MNSPRASPEALCRKSRRAGQRRRLREVEIGAVVVMRFMAGRGISGGFVE